MTTIAPVDVPVCGGRLLPQRVRVRGFTLIELVVTIAVAGILLAIAVPSYKSIVLNNRRASAVNDFVESLTYARGIAVSRRQNVVVCRSAQPTSSAPVCDTSTSTNWNEGWVSFVDTNASGAFDTGEEILRTHEVSASLTLNGVSDTGSNMASRVSFQGSGVTSDTGSVVYCDSRGWTTDARIITLTAGGRLQTFKRGDTGAPSTITSCTP